jgi:hypothetical protein
MDTEKMRVRECVCVCVCVCERRREREDTSKMSVGERHSLPGYTPMTVVKTHTLISSDRDI